MEARGRDSFYRFRTPLLFAAQCFAVLPMPIRSRLFEHYRTTKGTKGIAIRYCLLKSIAVSCGDNVAIFSDVHLLHPQSLSIGRNVSIQPMSYIDATGGLSIGSDVAIAHGSTVLSTSHVFSDTAQSIKDQGFEMEPTAIGDDVWIGAKATVLSGVTVGSGSIVGANSVVTGDVEESVVVAGSPARPLRRR